MKEGSKQAGKEAREELRKEGWKEGRKEERIVSQMSPFPLLLSFTGSNG